MLNRRAVLGAIGCALATDQRVYAEAPSNPVLNVVVTGGHPGDPEYGCGGTIARYARLGHRVTNLYLNGGDIIPSRIKDDPSADHKTG
jgi:hypothetical protein